MFSSVSLSELRAKIESGELEGRCIRRISSNIDWDISTNFHKTDWLPVHIKSTFYDELPNYLNLEPNLFELSSLVCSTGVLPGYYIFANSEQDFMYEFREISTS